MLFSRFLVPFLFLFALASTTSSTLAGQESSSADPGSEQETVDPASTSDETEEREPWVEPPDGVWLVDEDGKRYFIDRYPRIEGQYKWIDEEAGIVRPRHLMPIKVERYDDSWFYFKVYEVPRPAPREEAATTPSPEAAAAEAEPVISVPEADRLEFTSFDEGLPESDQWRNGLVVADMNGDGELDLVHGPSRKGQPVPVVFLGDGEGNWQVWPVEWPGFPYDYGDVTVADYDGDGRLDLALGVHLRGLVALVRREGARFELWNEGLPWVDGSVDGLFTSRAVESHDWDGDGRPDLLALSEGSTRIDQSRVGVEPARGRWWFRNLGDGRWEGRPFDEDDRSFGDRLLLADVDGDGRQDLVTDSRRIGDRALVELRTDQGLEKVEVEAIPKNGFIQAITVADFDGDGHQDLVVSHHRLLVDRLLVLWGQPGGRSWQAQQLVEREDRRGFTALGSGDFDGDGRLDLAGTSTDGSVWVFRGKGDRSFELERSPELEPGPEHRYCAGFRVLGRDLDRDGRDELIVNFAGEPGGEVQFLGTPRCSARGAIRVWRGAAQPPESTTAEEMAGADS